MANMELIDVKTLSSAAGSITFSDIPQTYTDLKILVSARDDRDGQPNTDLSLQVGYNGTINTGSIYTNKQLYGNGSTAGSQSSSTTYAYLGMSNGPTSTANTFGNTEIYITNYASANNKSISTDGVSENNATTAFAVLNANSIATSNPITDIKISAVYGSGNFQIGSTFYLYGISNVTSGTKATGGVVSSDGTYYYHMFPFSGTFTPTQSITADYLVIAGGGGGGTLNGRDEGCGGGGAGGLRSTVGATGRGGSLESALSLTANTAYTVTVGAGGAPGGSGNNRGFTGSNSVFSTITSTGGGFGSAGWPDDPPGGAGGSGGGGNPVGTGTANQGYDGGLGGTTGNILPRGAGGGGAGAAGGSGSGAGTAAGGDGVQITGWATPTQTGVNSYYAGGGGGGGNRTGSGAPQLGGVAGLGGGGIGGFGSATVPTVGGTGVVNTGGGGGGAGAHNGGNSGGSGGSGLVIIRYAI
jgi:hypothetical protein